MKDERMNFKQYKPRKNVYSSQLTHDGDLIVFVHDLMFGDFETHLETTDLMQVLPCYTIIGTDAWWAILNLAGMHDDKVKAKNKLNRHVKDFEKEKPNAPFVTFVNRVQGTWVRRHLDQPQIISLIAMIAAERDKQ